MELDHPQGYKHKYMDTYMNATLISQWLSFFWHKKKLHVYETQRTKTEPVHFGFRIRAWVFFMEKKKDNHYENESISVQSRIIWYCALFGRGMHCTWSNLVVSCWCACTDTCIVQQRVVHHSRKAPQTPKGERKKKPRSRGKQEILVCVCIREDKSLKSHSSIRLVSLRGSCRRVLHGLTDTHGKVEKDRPKNLIILLFPETWACRSGIKRMDLMVSGPYVAHLHTLWLPKIDGNAMVSSIFGSILFVLTIFLCMFMILLCCLS